MNELTKQEWDDWRIMPQTKAFVEELRGYIRNDSESMRQAVAGNNPVDAVGYEGIITGYECVIEAIEEIGKDEEERKNG